MFGEAAQRADVFADQLRRAVVIVDYAQDAVDDAVVDLPKTDVDSKEELNQEVQEVVDFSLDERADSLAVFAMLG